MIPAEDGNEVTLNTEASLETNTLNPEEQFKVSEPGQALEDAILSIH